MNNLFFHILDLVQGQKHPLQLHVYLPAFVEVHLIKIPLLQLVHVSVLILVPHIRVLQYGEMVELKFAQMNKAIASHHPMLHFCQMAHV
jgi:hypothetical protein